MKKDFFRLQEHGTTTKREVLAGITTFMTMAYVLAVQPAAICGFGPDPVFTDVNGLVISKSALLVMCALVSGAITLFMGLYANLPACPFPRRWAATHSRRSRKQRRVFLRLGHGRFFSARAYCLFW